MYNTVRTMKCYNKQQQLQNAHQVFQKGIMMSITSLKALRIDMDTKFGYKYLLTHRLNQDCLENFYSQMRYKNGPSDHPSPAECLYNMKAIILGKNPGLSANMHCNTIERDPEEYASATFHKCVSEANPSIAQCDTNEQFLEDDGPEEFLEALPESLDYNSDDGPEEFIKASPESLDCNSDDEPENIFEQTLKQYERVIELHIECLENNADETHQHELGEITLEFINDLSSEMELQTETPTLAEDGLGNVTMSSKFILFHFLFLFRIHCRLDIMEVENNQP